MSQQQNSPKFFPENIRVLQKSGKDSARFSKMPTLFSSLFSGKNKDKSPSVPPTSRAEEDPSGGSTIVFDSAKLRQSEKKATSKVSLTLSEEEKKSKRKAQTSIFRPRNKRPSYVLGTIITTAKVFGLALLVFIAAGIGAVFGVANAYLGTTPDLDLEVLSESALTSYIYDANGDVITTYSGTENREYASLDEIPKQLQQAVIAVEDVRFYHHNGVDLKRIISSFVGNMSSSRRAAARPSPNSSSKTSCSLPSAPISGKFRRQTWLFSWKKNIPKIRF